MYSHHHDRRGSSIGASPNVAIAREIPIVIEFAAVIQQILVTPDATTMQLDISVLDVSPLTELLDKEISVAVRTSSEKAPAEKQKPT